ncbi:cation efflux protein [Phialemonium atrogriseum]|uniref:Cation efflux protein n=1 Tax=Phialemonium atrogriseum TaxID=1093897 RepID=A0AAJ0FJV3_9PEZI|nr:cation efflux protein [Phialemonium atrogriseum]KAK1764864.1 cation efflux protein [Phialemonium atrogriseum]
MAWSKTTRISVMLGIDTVFFLLELIVGLIVGSLALMADAFHMLNDIISLLVGLWAVLVARKATTNKYTYGWLRAEILGAFFNAVFLIALCLSIALEALTRFIDPPEIGNPKLILIVGSLGLASNLVGFLVLGGHGHSHGPGEHEHEHGDDEHQHEHDDVIAAEEGHSNTGIRASEVADERGRVADVLPEAALTQYAANADEAPRRVWFDQARRARSQVEQRERRLSNPSGGRGKASSIRQNHLANVEDISIHPASFRQEIIDASRPQLDDESTSGSSIDENPATDEAEAHEETPLIYANGSSRKRASGDYGSRSAPRRRRRDSGLHRHHNHNKPKTPGSGHGHSHGDMGMNGMILHVLGDALGNVGVIVTALVIWLSDWPGRFYADPAVSLFITLIILRSAIPLTVATSKILLQATPDHIDVSDVRKDIQNLPGVISCHHVHIWQLSDTKLVASMHIQVTFPISEEGGERYMELARLVRQCLHAYGIHSATIQPEFCLDKAHTHAQADVDNAVVEQADGSAAGVTKCGSMQEDLCLLECVDDCVGQGCCAFAGSQAGSSHSVHSEHDAPGH